MAVDPLPKPLAEDASVNAEEQVVLISNDTKARFAVDRKTLVRFAVVPRNLLEGAEEEEPLPLDNDHCTEPTVAALALWLEHHKPADVKQTRVKFPLADGDLDKTFDAWDLDFIQTHLVPGGDMKDNKQLYFLVGLAAYLDIIVLRDMCCAYFAWHVRKVSDDWKQNDAVTPTQAVRGWFGLEGDYTEDELKELMEKYKWCRDVDYNKVETDSYEAHKHAALAVGKEAPPSDDDDE